MPALPRSLRGIRPRRSCRRAAGDDRHHRRRRDGREGQTRSGTERRSRRRSRARRHAARLPRRRLPAGRAPPRTLRGSRRDCRARAAGRDGTATRRLLLGPVTYLTEEETEGLAASAPVIPHPHPARPDPNDGEVVDVDPDATADGPGAPDPFALFWSLSFACRPEVFARIGGFDETYAGYGGEDTDFAFGRQEGRGGTALGRRRARLPTGTTR
ncbi:hypothetical protein IOD13_18970 [Brevibacterium casei]|nr:hypothetical protein [Brevibacterium casei]